MVAGKVRSARRCVQRFTWLLQMYDSRDIFQLNEGSMQWSAYRLLSVRLVPKKLKSTAGVARPLVRCRRPYPLPFCAVSPPSEHVCVRSRTGDLTDRSLQK